MQVFDLLKKCCISWVITGACLSPSVQAQPAQDWGFELATLQGDRFVNSRQLRGAVLVNFWAVDCPPCLAELPLLQDFAHAEQARAAAAPAGHDARAAPWQVWLVATDRSQRAQTMLQRLGITLPTLKGGAGAAALMAASGNRSGALPWTVLLRDGQLCATHAGAIDAQHLPVLLAQCR